MTREVRDLLSGSDANGLIQVMGLMHRLSVPQLKAARPAIADFLLRRLSVINRMPQGPARTEAMAEYNRTIFSSSDAASDRGLKGYFTGIAYQSAAYPTTEPAVVRAPSRGGAEKLPIDYAAETARAIDAIEWQRSLESSQYIIHVAEVSAQRKRYTKR